MIISAKAITERNFEQNSSLSTCRESNYSKTVLYAPKKVPLSETSLDVRCLNISIARSPSGSLRRETWRIHVNNID